MFNKVVAGNSTVVRKVAEIVIDSHKTIYEQRTILRPVEDRLSVLLTHLNHGSSVEDIFKLICSVCETFFAFDSISLAEFVITDNNDGVGIPLFRKINQGDQLHFKAGDKYVLSNSLRKALQELDSNSNEVLILEIPNLFDYVMNQYGLTQEHLQNIIDTKIIPEHIPPASINPLLEGVKSNIRIISRIDKYNAFSLILSNKQNIPFTQFDEQTWKEFETLTNIIKTAMIKQKEIERVKLQVRTEEDMWAHMMILFSFQMSRLRDEETGDHITRVKEKTEILLKDILDRDFAGIAIAPEEIKIIKQLRAGVLSDLMMLHDIGKIGIPDNILLKPSRLTEEEFEEMKTHVIKGEDIINNIIKSEPISNERVRMIFTALQWIIGGHHEQMSGKGYPRRLSGSAIPFLARLCAIVDVHDALTHKRVYKDGFADEKVKQILIDGSGAHFDPVLVDLVLKYFEAFHEIDVRLSV